MLTTAAFEYFQCSDFETIFLNNENLFYKRLEYPYLVEGTTTVVQHFHTKLLCQKSIFTCKYYKIFKSSYF